jgi:hypothetical protein
MYDMYPANWPAIDAGERKATRRRRAGRPASESRSEARAVQEAMNRRDNGGEPKK